VRPQLGDSAVLSGMVSGLGDVCDERAARLVAAASVQSGTLELRRLSRLSAVRSQGRDSDLFLPNIS